MWFEIDGHAVIVTVSDESLLWTLDGVPLLLHHCSPPVSVLGVADCAICSLSDLQAQAASAMGQHGQLVHLPAIGTTGMECQVLISPAETVLHCSGHGMVRIAADGKRAEVLVTAPGELSAAAVAASAILAMVAEHQFSPIHASLVERDGIGVMFCGERSRGKTSSCLAMARAGWIARADDRCFLRMDGSRPMVWGPGGAVRLRPDAGNLWPDLVEPMAQGRDWAGKRVVELEAIGGHAAAGSAICTALLFPCIAGVEAHRLEPMPKADALGEMLYSTGLAALPAHAALQFRDLTAMLEHTPCYRLHLGANMDKLPETIVELLE